MIGTTSASNCLEMTRRLGREHGANSWNSSRMAMRMSDGISGLKAGVECIVELIPIAM